MHRSAMLLLALAPAPALSASFDCAIVQQCGGGACEPFTGGRLLVQETGDVWEVSLDAQMWQGYSTTTEGNGGLVSIVLPPQNDLSGLISIFPTGEVLFTVHAYGDMAISITGNGNCAGEGG